MLHCLRQKRLLINSVKGGSSNFFQTDSCILSGKSSRTWELLDAMVHSRQGLFCDEICKTSVFLFLKGSLRTHYGVMPTVSRCCTHFDASQKREGGGSCSCDNPPTYSARWSGPKDMTIRDLARGFYQILPADKPIVTFSQVFWGSFRVDDTEKLENNEKNPLEKIRMTLWQRVVIMQKYFPDSYFCNSAGVLRLLDLRERKLFQAVTHNIPSYCTIIILEKFLWVIVFQKVSCGDGDPKLQTSVACCGWTCPEMVRTKSMRSSTTGEFMMLSKPHLWWLRCACMFSSSSTAATSALQLTLLTEFQACPRPRIGIHPTPDRGFPGKEGFEVPKSRFSSSKNHVSAGEHRGNGDFCRRDLLLIKGESTRCMATTGSRQKKKKLKQKTSQRSR